MPNLHLLPAKSALLVIDVQERLAAAMPAERGQRCVERIERLLEGARLLGVSVVVTEQYPKGLGPTVPSLAQRIGMFEERARKVEKIEFDASANEGVLRELDRLRNSGIDSLVLTGMEAHICVYQTARGLVARGFSVHVALDAVCSRSEENAAIAARLYELAGATPTVSETVLFDWLGVAKGEAFKAISKLVR